MTVPLWRLANITQRGTHPAPQQRYVDIGVGTVVKRAARTRMSMHHPRGSYPQDATAPNSYDVHP